MTTAMDWARQKDRWGYLGRLVWLRSLHANDGTHLALILAACDGAWLTSREVTRLTGLKGNSVRPLLYAAARKDLLLRRRAPNCTDVRRLFCTRYQYRLVGT